MNSPEATFPEPTTVDLPGRADEAGWHRLHPVTPFLRSWKIIVAALAVFAGQGFDNLYSALQQLQRPSLAELLIAVVGLLFIVGVIGVWATISWRMTRYRVVDGTFEHQVGILFRQHRRARLDRLQAVDIVQPLLGRIFGLVELRLEVAGGSGSDIKLQYLRDTDGARLRNTLLAQAAGVGYEGDDAPEAPEHRVVEVPISRLLGSIALSSESLSTVIVLIAVVIGTFFAPGAIFTTIPIVLGAASALWARFSRGFNFSVATSPDGLRLRHGLLETRTQTVPPGRVQAVSATQPWLWRFKGWWVVKVNVAGYASGSQDKGSTSTVLMPVATEPEFVHLMALVLPNLGTASPVEVLNAGLVGTNADFGFQCAPKRSRWLDPIGWRRNGFAVTGTALLLRRGRLSRHLAVVPHARTQSLGVEQGPVQRRLRLASVYAHSTPGPVRPAVHHLDLDVAGHLLDEQATRARTARAASGPERWMTTAPPAVLAPETPAAARVNLRKDGHAGA